MKRKKDSSFTTIGFSTILVVFVMLALITFTVLSVTTANADYKLSKKVADKTTAYYTANNKAEIILNDIDTRLFLLYRSSGSESNYFENVSSAMADLPDVAISQDEISSLCTASFSVRISDTQTLDVELTISYPHTRSDTFYTISKWQTITDISEESTEQTLHLLDTK